VVNTLAVYDVPIRADRQRLESLLRANGFVWLFPHARWSSRGLAEHTGLARVIRSRLAGRAYRVVLIEFTPRARTRARWLAGLPPEEA
jgi:hypothetical protein